jgi:two-component system, OmpR family, sensor histidine kinase SenX3
VVPLLLCVGAVLLFGIGWAFGRAGRPIEVADGVPRVSDLSTKDPSAVTGRSSPSVTDVLETHPTGVVVAAGDGRIEYRNAAVAAMSGTHVGVLLDEAIERHLTDARSGAASDETLELYGPPKTVLVVTARPLPSGGSVVFVEDISERRRIDQIRTDFVANVSHELKTPIGALSVLAETLLDDLDAVTTRRVAERMMGEAQRASGTIDDLIDLSRIELGRESTVARVRISDVIDGAVARVVEMAALQGVRVSTLDPVEVVGRRPADMIVDGDLRQLVSAIGNLVENAVKYSERGGLVQIKARTSDAWVEIAVTDHGVGIPQRDLDRIFERFYRVDRARSRVTGGTGLGLSIVRHVATNHGGEIIVTSAEGEGSTFVLRLPLATSTATDSTGTSNEGVA